MSIKFNISELGRISACSNLYWNRGFWTIDRNLIKAYLQYDFPCGMFGEVAYRYIHNPIYVAQLLIDSIVDLGGNKADYPWR